jgi:hypothetical protein
VTLERSEHLLKQKKEGLQLCPEEPANPRAILSKNDLAMSNLQERGNVGI